MSHQDVSANIQELSNQIRQLKEQIQNINIPELGNQASYNKNTDLIEESKQQLHHIIEQYFKDIQIIYIKLRRYYPTTEIQQSLKQEIEQIFDQLKQYREKIVNKTFNQQDLDEFQQTNYPQKQREIEEECQALQIEKYPNHTSENMPNIRIQNKVIESLYFSLNQYASVFWPSHKTKSDKIVIDRPNFFSFQNQFIKFVVGNQLYTYDLETQKAQENEIIDTLNIDQPSYVYLPDGTLFVSGGINQEGQIQGDTYIIEGQQIVKTAQMNVKRIGHSLVYVPPTTFWSEAPKGYIYAIGGRVQNKVKTKLCERYNITNQKWEDVEKMFEARSRAAVAYCEESHCFFVFFGTSSQQFNLISVEKFDLLAKKWERVNITNYLQGFDISWGNAVCFNEDQILLFGGLKDSQYFEDVFYCSKKLAIYNIENESITILDGQLPIDFLPLSSVIHNQKIYSIGNYLSCVQKPPYQSIGEGVFLIEIGQNYSISAFFG